MAASNHICVAFDLDDTLYKERDFVKSGIKAVAAHYAPVAAMEANKLYKLMDESANAFDTLLAIDSIVAAGITIADILKVYRNHRPAIKPSEGAIDAINELQAAGYTTALITDGRSTTQRNKIAALGLNRYISEDMTVISDEIGGDKLSGKPFRILMEICRADRYVYVGDNPAKDFKKAAEAGWTTVMLRDTDGVNIHSQAINDTMSAPAHITIDNLNQLIKHITTCQQH